MSVTERWAARAANPQLPLWLRVVSYAEAHADPTGICLLKSEQLHHDLDPTLAKPAISRAIASGIKYGWLHPTSHARRLVLHPQGVGPLVNGGSPSTTSKGVGGSAQTTPHPLPQQRAAS